MSIKDVLLACFVVLIFATNFLINKLAVQDVSAFTFTTLRFIILLPLLPFFKRPELPFSVLLMIACTWYVLNFLLSTVALSLGLNAGLAALLFQMTVFFGALFALIILHEVPLFHQMLGIIFGFTGLALIGANIPSTNAGVLSIIYMLGAAASCGLGNTLIKKYTRNRPDVARSMGFVIWVSALAILPTLGISIGMQGVQPLIQDILHCPKKMWFYLCFSSWGSMIMGGYLWCDLLRRYPVITINSFMLLLPIYTCVLGYMVFGEVLTRTEILAGVLILLGLVVTLRGMEIYNYIKNLIARNHAAF